MKVQILQLQQTLRSLAPKLRTFDAAEWSSVGAVLGAGQFRDREFKRLFNDYADNIYYAAGSTEANAYLLGGATPSSAQTTQYLLRNEALLFSRTATFSRAFLSSIVQ